MNGHIENPLTLADICARVNLNPPQLRRILQNFLGTSPGRYYLELRLERASQLLKWSNLKLMEIAAASGFSDSAAFPTPTASIAAARRRRSANATCPPERD